VDRLDSRAFIGLDADAAARFDETIGSGFAGKIAATHQPLYLRSGSPAPIMASAWARARGVRGLLGVPLVSDGEVFGVAIIGSVSETELSASERRLFAAVAERAASAVDRVRSRKRLEQSEARQRFLAEVGVTLSASLEIEETLAAVATMTVPRFADWCAIDGLSPDGSRIRLATAGATTEDDPAAESWRSIADGEERVTPGHVCVQLRSRDKNVGALTLVSMSGARVYGEADRDLARDLAVRIAMAIENADLYRRAQDAVRIREEFLSIASHELRTPLTPLKLYLGVMRRRLPEDREAIAEKFVDRQVDKMDGLVTQLLDVSKIAGGRLELQPEWVDVKELTERIVERFATNESGTALRFKGERLKAYLDPLRIEQLITNLVTNAIKYGRGKPVDIEITAEGDWMRLLVRDRGIGIDPAEQSRIFGRFERAASVREYGGFGLGLWIAQRVVEASGGGIAVNSVLGGGSEFIVRLPLRSVDSKSLLEVATAAPNAS
jgi:signal transduction histidine kinase